MSATNASAIPERGPGIRKQVTPHQWDVLDKAAIAVIHTEPDACDECKPYDNDHMRLTEAEDLLPQHPNCRCTYEWAWRPGVRSLSMTALVERAIESTNADADTTMPDSFTKIPIPTDATVVKGTPTGDEKDDEEHVRVPISSTGRDRDGDRFSERGLKDLRDQIRETSKPVFGNHGVGDGGLLGVRYDWKDIIGSQDDAEIEEDGDEKTLYSFVRPNSESEEGAMLLSYVKAGMPVGLSIGFRPLEYENNDDDEHVFHETDLLETSAVGIQSNQESVAGRAGPTAEAIAKSAASLDANLDEETLAGAIVSEVFARSAGGAGEAGGTDEQRTAKHTATTMGTNDDPTDEDDEQYVTRSELEEILDDHQTGLVKGLAAELDGSLGDDRGEEKGEDGESSELKSLVESNAESISDLKDAFDGAEVEAAETKDAADPDEDGTEDESAADDENATEDKAVGEEVVM